MQVDAENLMLGSGVRPSARGHAAEEQPAPAARRDRPAAARPGRPLDRRRRRLPHLAARALTATDGFNQVEAPLGCLIVFSTGAGKPAIAPAVETLNTFYTGSLVKLLASASDEISFSDFFRLVKLDVTQTMQNHPCRRSASSRRSLHRREHAGQVQPVAAAAEPAGRAEVHAAEEEAAWKDLDAASGRPTSSSSPKPSCRSSRRAA
jgi:hypothetical protein